MSKKKTYVSVVKQLLKEGNDRASIIEKLKEEFPDINAGKLVSKLNAAIKYIKSNDTENK